MHESKHYNFPKLSETEVLSLYSENGLTPAKYHASLVMIFERTTNRFLSILREPNDYWFPSTWAFPCGLIEQGKTAKQAAARETFEETSLKINEDDIQYITTYYDSTSDCIVHVHKTYIEDVAKVTVSNEHSGFMWCDRKLLEKITSNEDLVSPNMKNILDWTL
jgi:8-oxo-dGTP pyrophosphatase MutT (NUDIX family)